MHSNRIKILLIFALAVLVVVSILPSSVYAATMFDGQLNFSDGTVNETEKSATLSVSATGKILSTSTKNATITITNNSGSKATLSFNYSTSTDGSNPSVKINNVTQTIGTAGSYSVDLEDTESISIYLAVTSGRMGTSYTYFNMTNIVFTVAKNAVATVTYNDYGSVHAKYTTPSGTAFDGTIQNGGTAEVNTDGITLTPVPNDGAQFVAWVNPDDYSVISVSPQYSSVLEGDLNIKAVFSLTEP